MARTPDHEMSYLPGKMSEESEFILRELYEETTHVHKKLEALSEPNTEDDKIDDAISVLKSEVNLLTIQNDVQQDWITELKHSQVINENTISKLQEAVQALATKLDAEDVTNLDTDYLTTTNSNLF